MTVTTAKRFERGSVAHGRAIAFFDAIYGFAITLLVVNLDPPPAEDWSSPQALLDSGFGSSLFAFTVSFIVIAAFWWSSHRSLSDLAALDPPTIITSFVGIFFVVLIPFATQGIGDPGTRDTPLAVAIYAAVISFAVLGQLAAGIVARARGLDDPTESSRSFRLEIIDAALTPAVFLISIPIAYAMGPDAARWFWAILIVLGPVSGRLTRRAVRRDAEAATKTQPDD